MTHHTCKTSRILAKAVALSFMLYAYCLCQAQTSQNYDNADSRSFSIPVGASLSLVLNSDNAPNDYFIRHVTEGICAIIANDQFVLPNDSMAQWTLLPFDQNVDDIAWSDSVCVFIDSTTIYRIYDLMPVPLLLSDEPIDIVRPTNDCIFFVQDNTLCLLDFDGNEAEMLVSLPYKIDDYTPVSLLTHLFVIKDKIILYDNGSYYNFLSEPSTINAVAWHDNGLVFFATDTRVGVADLMGNVMTIIDNGARKLTVSDNDLYIVFNDNSCIQITNAAVLSQ